MTETMTGRQLMRPPKYWNWTRKLCAVMSSAGSSASATTSPPARTRLCRRTAVAGEISSSLRWSESPKLAMTSEYSRARCTIWWRRS